MFSCSYYTITLCEAICVLYCPLYHLELMKCYLYLFIINICASILYVNICKEECTNFWHFKLLMAHFKMASMWMWFWILLFLKDSIVIILIVSCTNTFQFKRNYTYKGTFSWHLTKYCKNTIFLAIKDCTHHSLVQYFG